MFENVTYHKSKLETQLIKAKEVYFEALRWNEQKTGRYIYKIMKLERELQLVAEWIVSYSTEIEEVA